MGKSVVVIDALRATSTMIVAFENGCSAFIPAATVEEAKAMKEAHPEFLLAGEREAAPLEGFDLGNSPRDFRPERVRGKTIVMTTTNGTLALLAAREGAEVFIGSFLNLDALSRLLPEAGRDLVIACAGEKDVFCLEDAVCGGALIDRLEKSGLSPALTDSARAAKVQYEYCAGDIQGMLCESEWGRHLESIGLGKDLSICGRTDSSLLVPVFREGKIVLDRS